MRSPLDAECSADHRKAYSPKALSLIRYKLGLYLGSYLAFGLGMIYVILYTGTRLRPEMATRGDPTIVMGLIIGAALLSVLGNRVETGSPPVFLLIPLRFTRALFVLTIIGTAIGCLFFLNASTPFVAAWGLGFVMVPMVANGFVFAWAFGLVRAHESSR